MAFGKLLSDRVKKKRGTDLDSERYNYISLDNAEPDFGNPNVDNGLISSRNDGTRRFLEPINGFEIDSANNTIGLSETGVNAGDYGDEDNIPTFTVDQFGRLTTASFAPISLNQLTTDDLSEGNNNLYYTDDRVRSAVSAAGDLSYDSSTGVFSFDVEQVYTKANFDSDFNMAIDEASLGGAGLAYDAITNTLSIDSAELENYFKGDIRGYFSADKGLVYNSSTGNFDIDSANIRTLFSGGTGITYTPATGVYDITNTGVIANTYGSASQVPVLKINAQGQIDSASTVTVAGVSSVVFDSASYNYTINTADGGVFTKMIHTRKPGLAAGEHGTASKIPIITVNEYGLVDSIGTTNVAGVTAFAWDSSTAQATITTADGGSFPATINGFNDDVPLLIGTTNPMKIYKNGGNSYIQSTAGRTKISTNSGLDVYHFNNEQALKTLSGGAVELYHDNIKQFETTDSGVHVFGSMHSDSAHVNAVRFDVNDNHLPYQEGLLWYDQIHKTLNFYSDDPNVIHEVGIEEHQRVYNNTGSVIPKGAPLYFSGNYNPGGIGIDVPTVGLADATDVGAYNAQGLAASNIANNSYGYCIIAGQLDGLDTSGLNQNTNFFVGLGPGLVQNASPTYPNYPMCLGWVVKADSSEGVLLVNQQNHSVNSFRVRTAAHIGTDLLVDGNLIVNGTQTITSTENVSIGGNIQYLNAGNTIGETGTTFVGTGLDDAFFAGHYGGDSATKSFYVKIDATGTPDTFEWGHDSSVGAVATGINITGGEQLLDSDYGIKIDFGATTGHTVGDVWAGTANATNVDTGIFSNRNSGNNYTHVGMYFDVSEQRWALVKSYDPEPAAPIDPLHSSFEYSDLKLNRIVGDVTGDVTGTVSTLSNFTTDDLSEGSTNKYYLKSRVDSDIAASLEDSGNVVNITINETIGSTVDSAYVLARVGEAPFLDSADLINGTLTYIDVDSADIGLVNITSGQITNVTDLNLSDGGVIRIGADSDFKITHTGFSNQGVTLTNKTGTFNINQQSTTKNMSFKMLNDAGTGYQQYITLNRTHKNTELYQDGQKKFETTSTGTKFYGKATDFRADSATIDNLYGTATNASRLNNEGPAYYLAYENFTGIPFVFDSNQTVEIADSNLSFNGFNLRDAVRGTFGTDSDMGIFHDNADGYIYNKKSGNLYIKSDSDGGNEAITLYNSGSKKYVYIFGKQGSDPSSVQNVSFTGSNGTFFNKKVAFNDSAEFNGVGGISISHSKINNHTVPGGSGTFALTSDLTFIDSAAALEFLSTFDSSDISTIISETVTNSFVDGLNVNAATATITANNTTEETVYPVFVDGATGEQGLETDTNLTYDPGTNVLTNTAAAARFQLTGDNARFQVANSGYLSYNSGQNRIELQSQGGLPLHLEAGDGQNVNTTVNANASITHSLGSTVRSTTNKYGVTVNGTLNADSATLGTINLVGNDIKTTGLTNIQAGTNPLDGSINLANGSINTIVAQRAVNPYARLMYGGNDRLITTAYGATVTGTINADSATISRITMSESAEGDFVLGDQGDGRVDFGFPTIFGPAVEMYNKHASGSYVARRGRVGITYGGEDGLGDISFTHRNSSTWVEKANLDAYGNFQMDGQLDADSATLNALTSTTSSLGTASASSLALASGQTVNEFSSDGTLAGNSNSAVPTEAAVKTYVDTQVAGAGGLDSADLTAGSFSNVSANTFTVGGVAETAVLDGSEGLVSTTTPTSIYSFATADYSGAELLVMTKRFGVTNQITMRKIIVTWEDTTAYATEYGTVETSGSHGTFDVDINSGNVRLLLTLNLATSTKYSVSATLI